MDDAINSANGKKTKWPRHLIQNICDCKNTAVKCLMKNKIKRAPLWGTNIKKNLHVQGKSAARGVATCLKLLLSSGIVFDTLQMTQF